MDLVQSQITISLCLSIYQCLSNARVYFSSDGIIGRHIDNANLLAVGGTLLEWDAPSPDYMARLQREIEFALIWLENHKRIEPKDNHYIQCLDYVESLLCEAHALCNGEPLGADEQAPAPIVARPVELAVQS